MCVCVLGVFHVGILYSSKTGDGCDDAACEQRIPDVNAFVLNLLRLVLMSLWAVGLC